MAQKDKKDEQDSNRTSLQSNSGGLDIQS